MIPGQLVRRPIPTYAFNRLAMPLDFSYIPAGTFNMGAPPNDKFPKSNQHLGHQVTISKPFLMLRTEVTQTQWVAIKGRNPSRFQGDTSRPVEKVSWYDAVEFCNELSNLERLTAVYSLDTEDVTINEGATGYRLPTEAEWEYACQAGTVASRYGIPSRIAWYTTNSGFGTHPVGKKKPNAWNLYDMLGNVMEWTQDWYGRYSSEYQVDPKGPVSGSERVVRGGHYNDYPEAVGSRIRSRNHPGYRDEYTGFRICRTLS